MAETYHSGGIKEVKRLKRGRVVGVLLAREAQNSRVAGVSRRKDIVVVGVPLTWEAQNSRVAGVLNHNLG